MKSRKRLSICVTIVLIIIFSIVLDMVIWYSSPDSFAEQETYTLKAEDALCSGCNVDNDLYIPIGAYGQFNFSADIIQAEMVKIRFSTPLQQDVNMRFYFAEGIDNIAKPWSVSYTFPKGKESATIHFTVGDWTDYRLDFYGEIAVRDITIGQKTLRTQYVPDVLRLICFSVIQCLLLALWRYVKPIRQISRSIYQHCIDPETRCRIIDILYMVFALVMLLQIILVSIQYYDIRTGTDRFRVPMLVFSAVSILLGRIWRNKGAWILIALISINYLRVFLFNYDSMDVVEPYLVLGVFAFFGCYSTMSAIKPEMRKTFLLVICALWTALIGMLSAVGLYVAGTGSVLGEFRTLTLQSQRLYLVRHAVVSGILESVSIAVAMVGFYLCKSKRRKLFLIPIPVMLLAGVLTATRTGYFLTAIVFSISICMLLFDKLDNSNLKGWKWIILLVVFVLLTVFMAMIQPCLIDGFNAITSRDGLLIRNALAESINSSTSRIINRNYSNADSMTGRLEIWKSLFKTIPREPSILWYGRSLDYNMKIINSYLRRAAGFAAQHCHNTTLQMLLENGLPAAMLYLSFQIIFLYQGVKLITNSRLSLWQRFAPVPAIVCIIGDMVDITSHFRTGNPQMVILYLFAGLTAVIYQEIQTRSNQTQ